VPGQLANDVFVGASRIDGAPPARAGGVIDTIQTFMSRLRRRRDNFVA
jgi:hypothetical protein